MLCDLCHKNIATVHLTEIIDGKIMEIHICQKCARLKAGELKQQLNITEFLGNLTAQESQEDDTSSVHCPFCGISFSDFKKKGLLGCAHCYITFRRQLLSIIEKVQGAVGHKGKVPPGVCEGVTLDRKLVTLRRRLEKAIQMETYEEAANIRDKIRELEKKLSQQ